MAERIITITSAASDRLRHLMATQGEGAAGIKLGVKTAGCSGLTYVMDFAREIRPGDEVIDAGGVPVLVDPGAVMYLIGTEMDFVQDKLGAAFRFTNPNETGRCGCGESFTV